jgi:hypothetical protein
MNKLLTYPREENQAKPKGGLYHKTQVNPAYNSNKIGNSKLAEEQTRYILEAHTIDSKDQGVIFVKASSLFIAFDYLFDTIDKHLSNDIIKEFYRIPKTGTSDAAKEKKKYFYAGLTDENFVK